jgi:hypothetical protein
LPGSELQSCLSRHLCVALPSSLTAVERLPTEQAPPCAVPDWRPHKNPRLRGGAVIRQAKLEPSQALHTLGCTALTAAMDAPRHFPTSSGVHQRSSSSANAARWSDSLRDCHSAKPCDSWWLLSPAANYAKPADPVNLAAAAQWPVPCAGASALEPRWQEHHPEPCLWRSAPQLEP